MPSNAMIRISMRVIVQEVLGQTDKAEQDIARKTLAKLLEEIDINFPGE